MRAGGAGGQVQGDDAELAEVGLQEAALIVMFFKAEADMHLVRLAPAIERHPGVTLLFSIIKITVIALGREHVRGR